MNKKNITLIITLLLAIIIVVFDIDADIDVNNDDVGDDKTALVVRVIDGDTFEIETGERVRMIGIDTPERGKYFFTEATDNLKKLIEGKKVVLKKDVSETDKYGRLLRHVYYEDVWINKKMIEDGFAKFVTFPPDVYHVDEFKQAQKRARENGVGLWDK